MQLLPAHPPTHTHVLRIHKPLLDVVPQLLAGCDLSLQVLKEDLKATVSLTLHLDNTKTINMHALCTYMYTCVHCTYGMIA